MKEYIDLSHFINSNVPTYEGLPSPSFNCISSIAQNGYVETQINMLSHIGTHIDAPAHILKGGQALYEIPLDMFEGTGLVLNANNDECLAIELAQKKELITQAEFVLLKTNQSHHWPHAGYGQVSKAPHNEIILDLLKFEPKGIGIDSISIDAIDNQELVNHRSILQNACLIIENLTNLDKVGEGIFEFSCFPLNINTPDGSPVRAVARLIH